MKFNFLLILISLYGCTLNTTKLENRVPFSSKGFAFIYNEKDFIDKIIKRKLDNNFLQIAHNKLRPGSLIKITNIKTNDSIILKNSKRFQYPEF